MERGKPSTQVTCLLLTFLTLLAKARCQTTGASLTNGPGAQELSTNRLEKPVINTARKEVTILANQTLLLKCTGNRDMVWTWPDNKHQEPPISYRQTVSRSTHENGVVESVLQVFRTVYMDTGYFMCRYKNSANSTARVYVYVSDEKNLLRLPDDMFPGMPFHFVSIRQGQVAILPCQTTNPKVKVALVKEGRVKKVLKLSEDLLFDPKVGFTIKYPNYFYHDNFHCLARLGNVTEKLKFVLHYTASTAVPQPEIETKKSSVMVGENITMKCFVRVSRGTVVHMQWTYSSNEHSDRIRKTKPIRVSMSANGYIYDEIVSTLTIRMVRKSDEGVYRCLATNADSKANSKEQSLYVYEKTFVYLTAMENPVEVSLGEAEVSLSAEIHAYPKPRLEWYRGSKLISHSNHRYEIRMRSDRARLKIYNPVEEDAGTYSLRGQSRDMNTTETFKLLINVRPTVKVKEPDSKPYYIANKQHVLQCQVTGSPAPIVTWLWQPCTRIPCTLDPTKWKDIQKSRNIPHRHHFSTYSGNLTVLGRESGFYRCKAQNKDGVAHQDVSFVVTDVSGGFGLSHTYLQPVQGDRVVVWCRANKFGFAAPKLYWVHNNTENMVVSRAGLTVTHTRTTYSFVVTTTIESIKMADYGAYYCRTLSNQGTVRKSLLQMYVKRMEKPKFRKPLQGRMTLGPGVHHTLECRAVGTPTPKLTWWKDQKPFHADAQRKIIFSKDKSRLTFMTTRERDSGQYTCFAENRAGKINSSLILYVQNTVPNHGASGQTQSRLSTGQIVMIVCIIVGILIIAGIIGIFTRRMCGPQYYSDEYLLAAKNGYNPEVPIDEQTDCLPYENSWEFPREKLVFGKLLGQGAFGKVVKAEAKGIDGRTEFTKVAVKMPRDLYDMGQIKALMSELKVLIHVGQHLNIVNLLGACTKDLRKGMLYVIVEYCRYGSLRSHLHKLRPNFQDTMEDSYSDKMLAKLQEDENSDNTAGSGYINANCHNHNGSTSNSIISMSLTTKDLVCYAFQISRGMEYLSSRKYIHRDLAARNVLLANDNVVKICDFGLAKDCYKYSAYEKKTDGPVPVKWMAVESLTHKIYTTKSDVWSFGILMWELFTVGGNPYPGVEIDETFVDKLRNGYRMDRPAYASAEIYNMMLHCWNEVAEERPNFTELAEGLGKFLQSAVRRHYIDLNTPYLTMQSQGYLHMGGDATYLPMSSTADTDEDDNISFPNSSQITYGNIRGTVNQSCDTDSVKLKPMAKVEGIDECRASPKQKLRKDLRVDLNGDNSVETKALVHADETHDASPTGSRSSGSCSSGTPPHDSYLNRDGVQMRKKNHKSGDDSVLSDTSSGFHSDYDLHPPPSYSCVMEDRSDMGQMSHV